MLRSATDIFAFQGSQTKPTSQSQYPDVIDQWPTLSADPLSASIGSTSIGGLQDHTGESWDTMDSASVNGILAVSDDLGYLHCYLDGSFPLGAISLAPNHSVTSLSKDMKWPTFLAHLRAPGKDTKDTTFLSPTIIKIPLLDKRQPRDLARLSSTARELMWYLIRVVREMKVVWFGSDSISGARELGPRWVQALEAKQQDQFGRRCLPMNFLKFR